MVLDTFGIACDASREDARRKSMDYSMLSPRTNEAPAITNESRKKAKRQRRPNAYTQTHTQTRTHTNAYTAEGARNSQGKNSLCLALLVNGRAWWVLAKRFRPPPSLESYKDPAGVRGRRILYRILSRLLLVLYKSRDRFAFENHRLTLAPDPTGSGTCSASKM